MKKQNIYDLVTKTILETLQDHQESWDRPWISLTAGSGLAYNPATRRNYNGVNQLLLSIKKQDKNYLRSEWMTFKQISNLGGQVIKEEKATQVIFYKTRYMDKNENFLSDRQVRSLSFTEAVEKGIKSLPMIRLYNVFNLQAQTTGLDPSYYDTSPKQTLNTWEQIDHLEKLIFDTGAQIEIAPSNSAHYNLKTDQIHMPERNQFKTALGFYETCLHELGHWTGHPSRLTRVFGQHGDPEYAKEELVAEISSAFCLASVGIEKPITNNVSYLKHWMEILKSDSKAIVKASADAQKASDFILYGAQYSTTNNPKPV